MKICVYCASSENIDKSFIKAGEEFGKVLAENKSVRHIRGGMATREKYLKRRQEMSRYQ